MGKDNKDSKKKSGGLGGIQLSGLGATVKGAIESAAAREAAERRAKIAEMIKSERKQLYCQLSVMGGAVVLMVLVLYIVALGQNPYVIPEVEAESV